MIDDPPLRAYELAETAWGDHEPLPSEWTVGRWRIDRRGDELADIRFDGRQVLRMVRAVARDRNWSTLDTAVLGVTSTVNTLSLELSMLGFGGELRGALTVSATEDQLSFELVLRVLRSFERNRIGLVVLHPPTVAGAPLVVRGYDGETRRSEFPEWISPQQPALDIAGLAWQHEGLSLEAEFSGEIFEMEDQRNWTDASFKTYSTPLAEPFPVAVEAGETIRQGLRVRVAEVDRGEPGRAAATVVTLAPAGHPLPRFGLGSSTAPDPLPAAPVADFILVEIDPQRANWTSALLRAVRESIGSSLDVRIVVEDASELECVLDRLIDLATTTSIERVGVFSRSSHVTEPDLDAALTRGLRRRGLDVDRVGGTRAHFTELNRADAAVLIDLPALTFSLTPQMHARERAQLVESIPIQRLTARQAIRMGSGVPVHVGPITLRPRFNAVATIPPATEASDLSAGYGPHLVHGAEDPRQRAGALATWTLASAAALAIPHVASVTFYETSGPRGVIDSAGAPYPVAEAMRRLGELSGRPAWTTGDPLPPDLFVIAGEEASGSAASIVIANLGSADVSLSLRVGATTTTVGIPAYRHVSLTIPFSQEGVAHVEGN